VSQRGPSIFAIAETVKEEEPQPAATTRGPGTQTPLSTTSNEYVVVRRPRPVGSRKQPRVDSHVESESSEEEDDSEEGSSEEGQEAAASSEEDSDESSEEE
jgi:hypothetical protein